VRVANRSASYVDRVLRGERTGELPVQAPYPVTKLFGSPQKEAMYTTLLMSTGLTFGTSALFGLSQGIIDQSQYSVVVAGVVASAVVPTMIANAFFMPRHLLPGDEHSEAGRAAPSTKLTGAR
jgi:glutathione-regulated potassium-efflux system ancillary protein KefC